MVTAADFPGLDLVPAAGRPDLLAAPVRDVVESGSVADLLVAPIDATLSDTEAFCSAYDVAPERAANCVVVMGRREGQERWAAVVLLATTRADVNNAVRRRLDVRKVSFAPMAEATARTGMEHGGITPIGLPPEWPILIDARVVAAGPVVVGAGIRAAKLVVDGADLGRLPAAQVVDDLAR